MKKILLFLTLLITALTSFGQTPRQLTEADSINIEIKVELAAQKLRDSLIEDQQGNEYLIKLDREFTVDTFIIEERQRLRLDIDYSTNGMVFSTLDANREYDQLLNKYYELLIDSLNEQAKEVLQKTQRNWMQFRDSELELNGMLMDDDYSGGGTIQRVLAASRVLELSQNRVVELYHYLSRKMK